MEHAPAGYISSLAQPSAHAFGLGFGEYDIDGGLERLDTESSLLSSFLPNASIYGSSNTPSQKSLSAKIEAKTCRHLLDHSSQERHRLAQFYFGSSPFRTPSSLTSLHPCFGSVSAVVSACPVRSQDTNCTVCGQVMDKGDRALACVCGGDRVTRHNLIRDVVHSAANDRANLAAVLENLASTRSRRW